MRSIIKVFGRSPFVPLQMHMEKVAECVAMVPEALAVFRSRDMAAVEALSEKLSAAEHEADNIKHDIRNNLPRGLFLPVDRSNLLRILTIQDSIANRAENIGVLLTFKQAATFPGFDPALDDFVGKSLDAFDLARRVIDELDELVESGFGGAEADSVKSMVDKVAHKEWESDIAQRGLVRLMLANEDKLSYGDFFLWTRVIKQISDLADRANSLTATVRTTLETS